jgi:catechol 2,3-dioxygenase-like lactoylglutathione lyase family enzyme
MGIAHLTMATRDVEATCAFFVAALGWQRVLRPQNIRCKAAWLRITADQELHLLEIEDFEPSPFEEEFGRHIAVEFPRSEFDALKARLTEHGAELIAPQRDTPFERFFFKDPNGYAFEVVESDRPSET